MKIEHSDVPIKSIDIQLVRVETCGCAEGFSKDGMYFFLQPKFNKTFISIDFIFI